MSELNDQHLLLLGEIKGIVQGLKSGQEIQAELLSHTNDRLDKVDERLRSVEQRSAAVGAVSGGAMSIGIALIVEGLRQWIGKGTPHP